jgi:hypothetical protein
VLLGKLVDTLGTGGVVLFAVVAAGGYAGWRYLRRSGSGDGAVPEPIRDGAAAVEAEEIQPAAPTLEGRSRSPLVDPQFTCSTGLVTIGILTDEVKELVDLLEPLLKVELRKTRQSGMARDLVEQDIRAVIIRTGFTDGAISEYAAHLYLEIFKRLHPKTYAHWTVDVALEFLQRILEKDRDAYTGTPTKPCTLVLTERLDAANGTGATKPTRDVLLITAAFAASVGGRLSEVKAAEIVRLTAIFEANG